jgi:hypothetical protein
MSAYWFFISKNIDKHIIHKIELYQVIKTINPSVFEWKVYTKDNQIYDLYDNNIARLDLTKEDQKILYQAKENNWRLTEKSYIRLRDPKTFNEF